MAKTTWPDHRARLEQAAHENKSPLRDAIRAALARIDRLELVLARVFAGAEAIATEAVESRRAESAKP